MKKFYNPGARLIKEQSDRGLHCVPFQLHLGDTGHIAAL